MCFAPQRRALFRHFFDIWTSKSGPRPSVFNTFDLEMCFAPQRRALFRHFFDIWTSKSGPRPSVFNTFDLEMCFAPQRRALFRHLNFQKWSEPLVFLTFWLRNVLRATTACTFSTSQLPKVVRRWSVLYILTSKCASRHNGVQLFISHLASWLRTRRFSEPTFRPSGATNHWKNTVFSRLSYLFAHLHLLSSDLFSSDSSHLCFSTVHIVGSFTSKLPSIITIYPTYQLSQSHAGKWFKCRRKRSQSHWGTKGWTWSSYGQNTSWISRISTAKASANPLEALATHLCCSLGKLQFSSLEVKARQTLQS